MDEVAQSICKAILSLNLQAGVTLCKRLPPQCKAIESYLKLALFAANAVIDKNANTTFYFFEDGALDELK